jgi:catechol 2,3-dioxygenase-like lactoylglutathione lyase family enzyme
VQRPKGTHEPVDAGQLWGKSQVPAVRTTLLVIYAEALDACREFYTGLGLTFVREQHGSGPEHYAAVLPDGMVIELYPATADRATRAMRWGFAVDESVVQPTLAPGRHLLTDPDGRTVDVYVS